MLSLDASPVRRFFDNLAGGATLSHWLWQLGILTLAVLLGWFVARIVSRQVKPSARWTFGEGDFERVAFPVFAYAFLLVGKLALARFQSVALLEIAASVLVAWIVIRVAVYVLGHTLPAGAFLRTVIRAVAWLAGIAVVLHVTGLLDEVIAALDGVGVTGAKSRQRISLWLVMQGAAALAITLTVAMWVARITEGRVMASGTVDLSTRVVVSKLVRITAIFLAVLIALPMVGIDVTALSIFGGALGVGLGFGLQKIAANYVSGFIVLLDRSLRIGDIVTVDGRRGEVRAIESRYTVIKGGDGTESIIPNEKLITESVSHHTYSDTRMSSVLAVTVSYDSDLDRACAILAEAAKRQPRVLGDPAPAVRVKALRDHGVDLELTVWLPSPAGEGDLRSDIFRDFLRAFREAGIQVAHPISAVRMIATAETP